ncbi:MAG TPA: acyl-CoA dehydrogenase family protein [Pseudonocardiaceae bacterium]|nr:acyl-CoA dehydrogenase family protein [Pseudonocardiaceae bacterium]
MGIAPEFPVTATRYESVLSAVIERSIGPQAAEIDRSGAFPREGVQALGDAGLLGLLSAPNVGGGGESLAAAAQVIETVGARCASTATVVLMHYAAVAVIEAHGPQDIRRLIARGDHLSSLAFSEVGSRSHIWEPMGTAKAGDGDTVALDARKSWVTSAGHADSYVWSSRPLAHQEKVAGGAMTLWLVPSKAAGLRVAAKFDGLGLRGSASSPVSGVNVVVPANARLGDDGAGWDIAMATALPTFLVLNAALSLGIMEALVAEAGAHLARSRLQHLDQTLAEQPVSRAALARLRIRTDSVRAFLRDTLAALSTGRDDAALRVLEVKAVAAEAAAEVADGALQLCGGAAFRKELAIERLFRDALAARVMAPTTEALHDFVGRTCLGLPLFDAPGA